MTREIFLKLIQAREFKAVQSVLNVMNPVDIAALLEDLEGTDLALAFRLIPKDRAAETFSEMRPSRQACLVERFTDTELKALLDALFLDDTVDLLEELPANLVTRILAAVDKDKRAQINTLLGYPEDSAGSIMTTEYVRLKPDMTVVQAIDQIRKTGIHKQTIYTCYVLEARQLVGIVSAKDLLTADDAVRVGDIMTRRIVSVNTTADREDVAKLLSKYGFLALPVLDAQGYMVGIVTIDDAVDVLEAETTEDLSIMAAVNPSEKPYFESSVWDHARNRIVWLLVLMFSAIATGSILTYYENAFQAIPLLVSFIPMLMDTGGNCGSQSSTLIIRGLALEEIRLTDIFRVMFKELRIALLVGFTLAAANGLRILITYRSVKMAFVIALSLMATVIISKLIGCTLPLLAKKVRLDPAIMAAPLITTLVDTCSVMIYFAIATRVFGL